jgi:hypothetical protein
MRVRRFDANGDVAFGEGFNNYARDSPEAVSIAILTRLELRLGEWMLDTTDGTDWAGKILGKYTAPTRNAEIRRRILQTPNVTEISSFSSDTNAATRAFRVACAVTTAFGSTKITETF